MANDRVGEGGPETNARQNIAAIRLIREIEAEDRPATIAGARRLAASMKTIDGEATEVREETPRLPPRRT